MIFYENYDTKWNWSVSYISTVSFEATLSCISQAIWNYNRHRTNQRIVLLLPYPRKVLTFAKLYQNRGNNSRDVLERRDTGLDYIFQEISRVESSVWNEESTYTTRLIALVSSGMYIYIYIRAWISEYKQCVHDVTKGLKYYKRKE